MAVSPSSNCWLSQGEGVSLVTSVAPPSPDEDRDVPPVCSDVSVEVSVSRVPEAVPAPASDPGSRPDSWYAQAVSPSAEPATAKRTQPRLTRTSWRPSARTTTHVPFYHDANQRRPGHSLHNTKQSGMLVSLGRKCEFGPESHAAAHVVNPGHDMRSPRLT